MKKTIMVIVILISVFISSVGATIINIPGDYPAIQAGIDSSSNGDTVLVQPAKRIKKLTGANCGERTACTIFSRT